MELGLSGAIQLARPARELVAGTDQLQTGLPSATRFIARTCMREACDQLAQTC